MSLSFSGYILLQRMIMMRVYVGELACRMFLNLWHASESLPGFF